MYKTDKMMARDLRVNSGGWIIPALTMIGGALFFGSFLGFVIFSLYPHLV